MRRIVLFLVLIATAMMRSEAQDSMSGMEMSQQGAPDQDMHHMHADSHDMMSLESDSLLQLVQHHATADPQRCKGHVRHQPVA